MESSFEITKFLGSGSYGRVYEVIRNSQSEVIKVFTWEDLFSLDTQFDLFLREVIGLLYSPIFRGIVIEKDADAAKSPTIGLVMDRQSCNLHQMKHDYSSEFSPEFVRQIFTPIMSQLQSLHQDGMIHRDIKPANILLCDSNQSSVLIDWSLMTSTQTKNLCAQTTTFRPPEIFEMRFDSSRPVSQNSASDVFAFGLCLLFCLLPYKEQPLHEKDKELTSQEKLVSYIRKDFLLWCESCSNRDLVQLMQGCLSLSVSDRWTMAEVSQSPFWTTRKSQPTLWHFVPCVAIKQAKNPSKDDLSEMENLCKEYAFVPIDSSKAQKIIRVECALTLEDRDIVLDQFINVAKELSWSTDSFIVAWSLFDHAFREEAPTYLLNDESQMQMDVYMIVVVVHLIFEGHTADVKRHILDFIFQTCIRCGLVTIHTQSFLSWPNMLQSFVRILQNIQFKIPFTQYQKQYCLLHNFSLQDPMFRKHFLNSRVWTIL